MIFLCICVCICVGTYVYAGAGADLYSKNGVVTILAETKDRKAASPLRTARCLSGPYSLTSVLEIEGRGTQVRRENRAKEDKRRRREENNENGF